MSIAALLTERVRFGDFELDHATGELRRNGTRMVLQDQSRRLLLALVADPGELVTRERLFDELWPGGIHVDFEHGLNTAVRRLREALGDTADTPRFIETIPRRGYRFIASVDAVERSGPRTVAVLPFLNLTADAGDGYLADGIAEDLLTELARISSLRVVARTSAMQFRGRDRNLRQIAKALHAEVIVEGSVRRAGPRVKISARVIDGRSDEQIWADSFDRDLSDIFAVQREVAIKVASALAPEMTSAEKARVGQPATNNLEAYQLYLQGRHCMHRYTEQGIRQAIAYFERAAALDGSYALPLAALGFAYMLLGDGQGAGEVAQMEAQRKARRAIDRALAVDPNLGDAHGVDAILRFMFEYDWEGAENAFKQAIALGPPSAETFDGYGLLLAALERYDEALAAQRTAHSLDPLAAVVMSDIATTLLRAGRYEEALAQAEVVAGLEPNFPMSHSTLGWALLRRGRQEEGLAELREAVRVSPGNTMLLAQLGQAYGETGNKENALDILSRLLEIARGRYVSPYHLAYIYTGLGDDEKAIDLLEKAFEERAGGVYGIRGSFLFLTLRAHPRFQALLRRMNLA